MRTYKRQLSVEYFVNCSLVFWRGVFNLRALVWANVEGNGEMDRMKALSLGLLMAR